MKKACKGNAGFTLIELMMVMAIIGILASMGIKLFSSYSIKAYNAVAQSDARNLSLLMNSLK